MTLADPPRRCNGGPNAHLWCGARASVVCTARDGLQWFACDNPDHHAGASAMPIGQFFETVRKTIEAVTAPPAGDPTTRAYPGDPYTHEAESPRDAADRMRALISRAQVTVVAQSEPSDPAGSPVQPTPGVHVARPNAPPRTCKGCRRMRDCRFGYCHTCCEPFLREGR